VTFFKLKTLNFERLDQLTRTQLQAITMCFMADSYYEECKHWGILQVESPCAGAIAGGLKSGCWNKTTVGTNRIDGLCPACNYRASVISSQDWPQSTFRKSESEEFSGRGHTSSKHQTQMTETPQEQTQSQFQITHMTCNGVKAVTRTGFHRALIVAKQDTIKMQAATLGISIG
jgi:hypothetical protein